MVCRWLPVPLVVRYNTRLLFSTAVLIGPDNRETLRKSTPLALVVYFIIIFPKCDRSDDNDATLLT